MSARNRMIHRCDIERDAGMLETDEWGDSETPSWSAAYEDVSCYFWFDRARTIMDGNKQVDSEGIMLMLPLGTDVTQDDRISTIVDRRGRTIQPGPLRIDSLGRRTNHLVLMLTRTS